MRLIIGENARVSRAFSPIRAEYVYRILCQVSALLLSSGADPGFQVRGAHLEKLRRVEGGAKIFGVFRVKNHDFTQKKSYFFPILRGARAVCAPPPWIRP